LLLVFPLAGGSQPALRPWQAGLQSRIDAPRFAHARWGLQVISLQTGEVLFERNAHAFFQPASNAKLFTAALVLDQLGPDGRIRTPISASAPPTPDGVIHGQVCIHGRGDPTFRSQWQGQALDQALRPLLDVLRQAGVRRIEGDLVGDEGFLEALRFGSGWTWEDLEQAYGSPLSALSLDGNSLKLRLKAAIRPGDPCEVTVLTPGASLTILNQTVTTAAPHGEPLSARRPLNTDQAILSGELSVGSKPEVLAVPVRDPARFFMNHLLADLERAGIRVTGGIRIQPQPPWETRLGNAESPPAAMMVREMMKRSDNLTASLLFANVGRRTQVPGSDQSPEAAGCRALTQFLDDAGLSSEEVRIEEGSGLSRNSLTTPGAIVALLRHMREHPAARDFVEALPVAGVDGTLEDRFIDTPAQGNLRAKTGTLRWTSALSGYVTSQAGEELAFSILLDRYQPADSGPTATEEVDAVALRLTELPARPDGDATESRK